MLIKLLTIITEMKGTLHFTSFFLQNLFEAIVQMLFIKQTKEAQELRVEQ